MHLFRWALALLFFAFWAAAAFANAQIVFGQQGKEDERRPSMVMFMGGICAALALRALPFDSPRAKVWSWVVWFFLALLDAGSLGYLLLIAWTGIASLFTKKEP